MNKKERNEILEKAKEFFKEKIAKSHFKNTKKAGKLKDYNINPFLSKYLANFLTGNDNPESIAKAMLYPRALGTSINTSFGTHFQFFCSSALSAFATVIPGLDIEFIDQIDGRKKYCQLKSGPNTINKDDVKTILDHFGSTKRLSKTNKLDIRINDLIVGVLYGEPSELSHHYKMIEKEYPVYIGNDFWERLTGSKSFYSELIDTFGEVAKEYDGTRVLDETIKSLGKEIQDTSK